MTKIFAWIFFILLFLLSPLAYAKELAMSGAMMSGKVSTAAACTSGTANVTQATATGTNAFGLVNAWGQGFKTVSTGKLYSIQLYLINTSGSSYDITMRWGNSNNLTTYYGTKTVTVPAYTDSAAMFEFVFADTVNTLTSGTSYYFGAIVSSTDGESYVFEASDVYAGGDVWVGTGWNMSSNYSYDTKFNILLCN